MVWCMLSINDSIPTNTNIEQMYVCANERSDASLENFGIFTFLNCYFFQYYCRYNRYLSQYKWHACRLTCTDKPLTLSKCICMRASELRNVGIFTFLNCYFFQYFVGRADTLSVQMTCLSAYMYRQIS